MAEKNAITLLSLQKDYPDVHAAVFKAGQADGRSKERALFAEILKVCGTDYELAFTYYRDGQTPAEVATARLTKAEAENTRLRVAAALQIDPDDETAVKAAYQASDQLKGEYFSWQSLQSAIRRQVLGANRLAITL